MKFAKATFIIAGIWGIAVLTPLYFLFDITGRQYPVPTEYPQFYYGFLSITMAWQIAFLIIGSNPVRFRPLMIAAIIEKAGYVLTLLLLHGAGRLSVLDTTPAIPDSILGILFVIAFVKTRRLEPRGSAVPRTTEPSATRGIA
ncbi:MAG: hypothetical protein ACM3SQ_18420 [Betaproteobacteria bacterium]